MHYIKEHYYIVTHNQPLTLRTKASDDGVEVTTLSPGRSVFCKSFTHDDNNDVWIRNEFGWIRATRGNIVYVS